MPPISPLIDAGAARLEKLEARGAARPQRATAPRRQALSAARGSAAQKLDKAVNAELAPLKLERAQFIDPDRTMRERTGPEGSIASSSGCSTNPGTRPGPLMKVASGGELSRFLLALKVVLADRGSAPTLVFDEIDTGVGGAVADAIGAAAGAARVAGAGDRGDPCAAGRGARRPAFAASPRTRSTKGKRVATRVAPLGGRAPPRGNRPHAGRRRDHRRSRAPPPQR